MPDMIVGTSAGAINGTALAVDPTIKQTHIMERLWVRAGERKLIYVNPLEALYRMARGKDYVVDNRELYLDIRRKVLPPDKQRFGSLKVPLYITITHLMTHTLYVYGDDPDAYVADAVVTSAAVPGWFNPTRHLGEIFVDGGVVSNIPVQVALERGADELWVLDIASVIDPKVEPKSIMDYQTYAIRPTMYRYALHEVELAAERPDVIVHHIPLYGFPNVGLGDFSKTHEMVEYGIQAAQAYLANPKPDQVQYPPYMPIAEVPRGPAGTKPVKMWGRK
jgi:NTE family protein